MLIAAVGPWHGLRTVMGARLWPHAAVPVWPGFATAALLWLLLIPSCRGLLDGHSPSAMLRDIIPLLFFFLPLFLHGRVRGRGADRRLILLALSATGGAFALRYFVLSSGKIGDGGSDGLLYLASSPAVLFTAIFLPVWALDRYQGRPAVPGQLALEAMALATGLICLGALATTLQRGALGLSALAFALLAIPRLGRSAGLTLLAMVAIAAAGLLFADEIALLFGLVDTKTRLVGLNGRAAEFAAVLAHLAADPVHLAFGSGWGADFASPAVGGYRVGYTHSFISYLLLKGGIAGTAILVTAMVAVIRDLNWKAHSPAFMAALAATALSLSVYTSYKFLGFGVVLWLLVAWGGTQQDSDG